MARLTEATVDVAVLAERAERLGFESLWAPEHTIIPVHTRLPVPEIMRYFVDPFIMLARASAVTSTLKLGTAVCLVPERNPLLVAKEVATLDMYSGGRFLFGVGAGWLKEETELMGGDFDHRWTQTRDAVLAMKELWAKSESEYAGSHYRFPPVYSFPRPAQRPHPPVLLGGTARNVFKRVVAWGDGWIPYRPTPEQVRNGRESLDRLAGDAGRDPASIEITADDVAADSRLIEQFADAGAERVVVSVVMAGEEESLADLDRIAEAVLR
jgi:probable F420-dependent oxidoreductase